MKFRFKIQKYQTDAVENTVEVFNGQPSKNGAEYRRDLGKNYHRRADERDDDIGFRNNEVELTEDNLLQNIRRIQGESDIKLSKSLVKTQGMGVCQLDVEMETGTGKTYVYIKTMFEMHKRYGWSKFIIVVPSIAIREGVASSIDMLKEHFFEHYKENIQHFIYRSDNLHEIDSFSSDPGIYVMIINSQAFARDFKADGKKTKASLIIYDKRDEFFSRRPIDVISANRPIVIMDEPQKMEGTATQNGIKNFKPLFVLNYSATHKTSHNCIYALDALDAYKQKLVKKIAVKGFTLKNLGGTNGYMYLDNIILSKNKPPMAKIEIEVKRKSGEIVRERRTVGVQDDLYVESNELNEYKGYAINDISPEKNCVYFTNGEKIVKGDVVGDVNEEYIQRLQIRETIKSHFQKERDLFKRGIKCLSLFFIDEVANYKKYEDGEEIPGYLWKTFEDEYNKLLAEQRNIFEEDYWKYLNANPISKIHSGYFSIDKKGHAINSKGDKSGLSDDISAYELILKNKARLLDMKEPVRFIFSHSALREGWDNPNVFQICTLRHANSSTAKRQEVGRGLRICVDKDGVRQDESVLGDDMHIINRLTVIANESYASFTEDLQKDTRLALRERPEKALASMFEGRKAEIEGTGHTITKMEADLIQSYLFMNDYIDENGTVQETYRLAVSAGTLAPLPAKVAALSEAVHTLVQSIYDEDKKFKDYVDDDNKTEIPDNKLNENFAKAEFQELWKKINHKYAYTVHYDSNELITNVANVINMDLYVTKLTYIVTEGEQTGVNEFGKEKVSRKQETNVSTSNVPYDLVGEIAKGATLTRKTVVEILKRTKDKLHMFKNNPEEYIRKVIKIIKEQKATMIVESIGYNEIEGKYESSIFTASTRRDYENAYDAKKHITDYAFLDSAKELELAKDMDKEEDVVVYAKLPRSFQIPTPVGDYAPDWAIAFRKGSVKHVYFVAETKGNIESMELKGTENAKIACARKLFNEISTDVVRYEAADSYQQLMNVMEKIK